MYRRFREFVALRKELLDAASQAVAAAAAALVCDDDDDDDDLGGEEKARRRRAAAAASAVAAIPALPKRRWFGSRSTRVLRHRMWGLDAFLVQLVLLAGGADEAVFPGLARAVARFLMLTPNSLERVGL